MNRNHVLSSTGLLLLLALYGYAQMGPGGGAPGGAPGGRTPQDRRSGESILEAQIEERHMDTSVAGRLRPAVSVAHASPVTGTVTGIHVRVGQKIQAETPLFTVTRDESGGSFAPVLVRSRIAGIVASVSARLHNEIRGAETGIVLIDPSLLVLESFLSDKDVTAVRDGTSVYAMDSLDNKLPGTLVSISPEPDYQTGLFRLGFEFNPSDPSYWTGRFIRIDLPVETIRGIFVAQALLVRRYGQYYIWTVMEDNTLSLRRVQTGISIGDEILIESGLGLGDRYLREITGRESEGMQVPGTRTGN